jgi:hypothetical protein
LLYCNIQTGCVPPSVAMYLTGTEVVRPVSVIVTAASCARNTLYHVMHNSAGQRARKQAVQIKQRGVQCFGVGLGQGGRAGLELGPSVS